MLQILMLHVHFNEILTLVGHFSSISCEMAQHALNVSAGSRKSSKVLTAKCPMWSRTALATLAKFRLAQASIDTPALDAFSP